MRKSKVIALFLTMIIAAFTSLPMSAFAADTTVMAVPVAKSATNQSTILKPLSEDPGGIANLKIFASSDASGSSFSTEGHAWIVLTNYRNVTATFGKLSGIGQYKSISIGTWGNKSEHMGLWYNLESQFRQSGHYTNSVSLSMDLTESQLATVNNIIINNDSWSKLNNCSEFAEKVWNSVSTIKVDNGLIATPTNLRDSIKSKSGYQTGIFFSYDYLVYYAQGTGTPKRSDNY